MDRHKVFISYHDGRGEPEISGDWEWRRKFEAIFSLHSQVVQSGAVQDKEIDPAANPEEIQRRIRDGYLFDSSVTVVLIGARTWQRMHVDWEISASIRQTERSPRSGLLGILLPSHPDYRRGQFHADTIPARLYDNVSEKFAHVYDWTETPAKLQHWVQEAYDRKGKFQPVNTRPLLRQNLTGAGWAR